ncbi:hypothetical protein DFP72DRAFT_1172606 [Ephemerocybe angulata]|uniref:Uncharacterized protein n=1 Tax=Ephemerocybe angulata TaxID=980116 RepID=A0A8H6HQS4_9AGAR|nr:hypothetical protein DFP72DRAFT_1172606 [Tulosesus angulatus]
MVVFTRAMIANPALASKKVALSEAKRESKLLAAAARKAEKENTDPTLQRAEKSSKVKFDEAAFRKWILEQDPRCKPIDERNVKCKTCDDQDIKLENVFYLRAWFKHVNRKAHQDREEEWAKKANVARASLRIEAPKISDFSWTRIGAKKVAKGEEVALIGEALKSWIEKMKTFPSVHPSLGRDALPPPGFECQCTSAPGGCEHGPLSLCNKGAECTLDLCAYHRGVKPSSGRATSVPRALCILRI